MSYNPFLSLKAKLTACLKLESKLTAEEREASQVAFLTKIGNTQVSVIKGGVNSVAITLGKGERKVMFPDDALDLLDSLGKRPYWYYEVNGQSVFYIGKIIKTVPSGPGKIVGVGPKGQTALYVAKPTLKGGFEWQETKRKP
jgi:hypothetical protein